MKVLYLDHPEADFLSAVLYMGLCEELGDENVVDCPHKDSYHGQNHRYPSQYAQDPGRSPWQSYEGGAHPMGLTSPFPWMRASKRDSRIGRDEVLDLLRARAFDLAVVAAPRTVAISTARDLIGQVPMPPIVLVDGEDYPDMRWDVVDLVRPRVYFKRELLASTAIRPSQRVEPFPFASPIPERTPQPKDIDVFFLGGVTWPARAEATAALRSKLGSRFVGGGNAEYVSYDDYLDRLSRSRVAVSIRGFGHDTLRFWEIPSFDTMLVCDRLPIRKPHPFEHDVHAAYFDSAPEMVNHVERALGDEGWRGRIASAGNVHLRAHHTTRARARQLLQGGLG